MNAKTVTLSNDLTDLLEKWSKNPQHSELQSEFQKMMRLKDKIICDIHGSYKANRASRAKRFWSWDDHVFSYTLDLIRMGILLHLDLYRTLALVLKGQWEDLLAHENGENSEKDVKTLKNKLNPDTKAIFLLFEEHGQLASTAGYNQHTFDTLAQEVILADLHLVANNSPELQAFIQRTVKERELLKNSTKEQEQAFWIAKCCWLELQEQLAEILLLVENRRLENANINQKWMAIFGEAYIELQEQISRFQRLELHLNLKEADPNLSQDQLNQKAVEIEAETQKKLEELRFELSIAMSARQPEPTGVMDEEQFNKYLRECKRILRELWQLLHPDTLKDHPSYGKLTDEQKLYLKDLWNKIMKIRPKELGFKPNQVGYNNRSLNVLLDALAEAKAILKHAGLNTDVKLIIQGETTAEQLEWLESALQSLESEIENLRAELKAILEDEDVRGKSAILACPEQYEKVEADMLERANQYRIKADELEAKLSLLFEVRL